MAAERPCLSDVLTRVSALTQSQCARIVAFTFAHVAKGDRTEPDGCLRLSLGRDWRLAIQIHGLGSGRWMLVFDDGKVTAVVGPSAFGGEDAWLESLTGLANRRHFNDRLREALDHATAETCQAILLVDLDSFGPVNEAFGHTVGDALLCLVAQRLRRQIRDDDLLARLGGDEFALLLRNGAGAEPLSARIVAALARPFQVEGQLITISASIGMVRFPEHGTTVDDLMRHAHLALYQAKVAGGRAGCVFDASMADESRVRQDLETDLRSALALHQISLIYRPCGDVWSRSLTGFEARLRWTHPTRGVMPEADLLQLGEASGLFVAHAEWALMNACLDAASWPAPLAVIVRVSRRQFSDGDRLTESVGLGLSASGLAPGRLQLKIPEAALLGREDQVLATLHKLRALGVSIALVDFAVGPSLPSRLRSLPFQAVAFELDNPADVTADPDRLSTLNALSAAGFDQIGCYLGDLLNSAPGTADVMRLQATTSKSTSAVE
jgi:diguanylate cyclase (GGDEF)-like protein